MPARNGAAPDVGRSTGAELAADAAAPPAPGTSASPRAAGKSMFVRCPDMLATRVGHSNARRNVDGGGEKKVNVRTYNSLL